MRAGDIRAREPSDGRAVRCPAVIRIARDEVHQLGSVRVAGRQLRDLVGVESRLRRPILLHAVMEKHAGGLEQEPVRGRIIPATQVQGRMLVISNGRLGRATDPALIVAAAVPLVTVGEVHLVLLRDLPRQAGIVVVLGFVGDRGPAQVGRIEQRVLRLVEPVSCKAGVKSPPPVRGVEPELVLADRAAEASAEVFDPVNRRHLGDTTLPQ